MSTKSTVAHGDKFHLYHDGFDDRNIYLELKGVDFEVTSGSVTVAIPLAVWAYIRRFGEVNVGGAGESEEELRERAERQVARCRQGAAERRPGTFLYGPWLTGNLDEPAADQVEKLYAALVESREETRKLAAEIRAIEEQARS